MKQYFITQIQSRQGQHLQIVLQFTHRLFQKPPSLDIHGKIQVFDTHQYYQSAVSNESLNQDVVWDSKYLNSIQNAFNINKQRSVNLTGNSMSIAVEINKGMRLTILKFELRPVPANSLIQRMMTSFQATSVHFQSHISEEQSILNKVQCKNLEMKSQLNRIKETAKFEIQSIKQQFLRIINPLKLKMKKGLNTNRQKQCIKNQQIPVKIQNNLTIDDQIIKFCF